MKLYFTDKKHFAWLVSFSEPIKMHSFSIEELGMLNLLLTSGRAHLGA